MAPSRPHARPHFVTGGQFAANPNMFGPLPALGDTGDEVSASERTDTTFSTLKSLPIEAQDLALQMASLEQPRQFRRAKGAAVDVTYALKHVFGKPGFKGKQKEIMDAAVKGQDILVVAPTGMGKSLCFQVPAVAEEHGLTIVVTPLISLMQDQINNLKQCSVKCAMLTGQTIRSEIATIEKDLSSGHPRNRLLYITPERLANNNFKALLETTYKQRELNRLVVDEAHCICDWGLSFRPDYQLLGSFRETFPDVPIMALTASAPPAMRQSIIDSLRMDSQFLFTVVHPFNRPNLFYEVRYLSEENDTVQCRLDDIYSFIDKLYRKAGEKSRNGGDDRSRAIAGIVYARARKTCDEIASFLRRKGLHVAAYHKGLSANVLARTQRDWSEAEELVGKGQPRVDIIVATVAFGLGIDKPNTRFVLHYDLPKSMEGFYQETGRAGRDGHASRTIVYYSREDAERVKYLVNREYCMRVRRAESAIRGPQPSQRAPDSLTAFLKYCEDVRTCRHINICRYFGERINADEADKYCGRMCDCCKDPERTRRRKAQLSSNNEIFTQTQKLRAEADQEELVLSDHEDECKSPTVLAPADCDGDTDDPFPEERVTSPGDRPIGVKRPKVAALFHPVSDDDVTTAWGGKAAGPNSAQSADKGQGADSGDPAGRFKAAPRAANLAFNKPAPSVKCQPQPQRAAGMSSNPGAQDGARRKPLSRAPASFKTPFADDERRAPDPKRKCATAESRSSSPNPISHDSFTLVPSDYTKPLPKAMRRQAVESLDKLLCRVLLCNHGVRSGSEVAEIWRTVNMAATSGGTRREVVLRAAVEIESDIFFLANTTTGYRDRFERRRAAVQRLTEDSVWIGTKDSADRTGLLAGLARAARLHRAAEGTEQVAEHDA